ncbi:glycosyltransferase family 2 protein [Paraflavitalea pollutisoli]|uniref:glycosyltransferase family 2 protein n=1 Tax=Paraflavitalea pollutisoli TaxID=3034143 RepID=UPI0023EE0915|nr:glycosyltransferase family 2 protein [Paraflavitalea sp. H1-2-19X]
MLLSVIIVNYNVKYFLEQCLCSVYKAIAYGRASEGHTLTDQVEVWIVDNNSTDGSLEFLRSRFPAVNFLANDENVGFSRANNQALSKCQGKYILFLNPDTILPENCFQECASFMEKHDQAGALGLQMIDGSGKFLPESKRGFPSPWVSFCKMIGLTKLFPGSRLFGTYYLGHLPNDNEHAVDVLSGAFMWVRKEVLNQIGGFDERFFMYAEDIDLSYCIQLAGYINYYLPEPRIIHFKGESTSRDARYVRLFYTAMILFVEKHYKGLGAFIYKGLLKFIIGIKLMATGKKRSLTQAHKYKPTSAELFGDSDSKEQMKTIVPNGFGIVEGNRVPLIICEGSSFSYRKVINEVASRGAERLILVHGSDTGSAVGSDSKNWQGTIIS